jgi:short-subunit dehydrogenase
MNTTLITGASSGIGAAFARKLAARGRNVFLVARSEDKLIALCNELGRLTSIRAQYLALDLRDPDAGAQLLEETKKRELEIEMLINNAGFGSMGDFVKLDLNHELEMIQLNIRALVDLTQRFLWPMRDRKRGTIINVASTAAFQAVPYMATYAATKAFVLSFSEALWEENRAHGVHVMAPGRDGNKLLRSCRNRSSTDAHDPNGGRSSRNSVASVDTGKAHRHLGMDQLSYGRSGAVLSAFVRYQGSW